MSIEHCECLSSLSQKKGALTENEAEMLVKYNTAWGCDICQSVCPHTERGVASGSAFTPIEFFWQMRTPHLTYSQVLNMSDEEFALRAYSWRKRETVLRNLLLFEDKF
jgi:epoxyqueuosine reductase